MARGEVSEFRKNKANSAGWPIYNSTVPKLMITLPHLQQYVVSIGKLIKAMLTTVRDKLGN